MRTPKENVDAGIQKLKQEGHSVKAHVFGDLGTQRFEVDVVTVVSWEQMQCIGAGEYSFAELQDEFKRQAAEEAGGDKQS
jgi:hypothetical protein